jgi:prefoldin subunit 5
MDKVHVDAVTKHIDDMISKLNLIKEIVKSNNDTIESLNETIKSQNETIKLLKELNKKSS